MSRPRLLLTRPEPQSRAFADAAEARLGGDLDPVIAPVLRIEHLPFALDPAGFDGLVFTSANAVAAFAEAGAAIERPAWCVGDATARAAAGAGLAARSAAGCLDDLAARLRREAAGMALLQLRGRHVSGDLAEMVAPDGPRITEAVVYEQRAQPLNAAARAILAQDRPLLVPLFSPRSARLVAPALIEARARLHVAAMSPAVAAALPVQARAAMAIAPSPDVEGMLLALGALMRGVKSA